MSPEGPPKPDTNFSGNIEGRLNDTQIGAIKAAIRDGLEIQRQIPEIVDDYTNGVPKRKIVEKYQIQSRFGIKNPLTAENAVGRALFGYDGGFNFPNIEPFSGLITDSKNRELLSRKHQSDTGKKAVQDKTGIHAWTFREKSDHSKKNAAAAGFIAYSEAEKLRIKELAALPEFRLKYREGSRVSTKKVAAQINTEFHKGNNIRTPDAIVDVVQNLKKPKKEESKQDANI
jgi:hypothetical protein